MTVPAFLSTGACGARSEMVSTDRRPTTVTHAGPCAATPSPSRLYSPPNPGLMPPLTGDGQRLYATVSIDTSAGDLEIVSIDPCTGEAVVIGNPGQTSQATPPIYPFGGVVYFASSRGNSGDLFRTDPVGGSVTPILDFTVPPGRVELNAFAIDATNAYGVQIGFASVLVIASIDGSARVDVGSDVHATIPVIDDSFVFFAEDRGVARVPKTGGAETILTSGLPCSIADNGMRALAGDATYLFVAMEYPAELLRVPKDGTPASFLAPLWPCTDIAVDDAYVYFGQKSMPPTGLQRIAKGGGEPTTIASGAPGGIYVDARSVYWSDGESVWKVDKP